MTSEEEIQRTIRRFSLSLLAFPVSMVVVVVLSKLAMLWEPLLGPPVGMVALFALCKFIMWWLA